MKDLVDPRIASQTPEQILASRMGAHIQVCRTGQNPIAAFVLGLEEQELLSLTFRTYYQYNLLKELHPADRRECRFMGYLILFSTEIRQCQPVYFPRSNETH